MGSCVLHSTLSSIPICRKMLKLVAAVFSLLAAVEGSNYGYGGYDGYGGYGSYGGYGYGTGYGTGYGYGSKVKRSVGHGEQVHVSGAAGQTVVTAPTLAYGAPAHGSYYYAPNHLSYAPHYPRYGYSDYYHYDPRVTATHAAYSHTR